MLLKIRSIQWSTTSIKSRGMYYPVCRMVHIKDPLLLFGNISSHRRSNTIGAHGQMIVTPPPPPRPPNQCCFLGSFWLGTPGPSGTPTHCPPYPLACYAPGSSWWHGFLSGGFAELRSIEANTYIYHLMNAILWSDNNTSLTVRERSASWTRN